MPTLKNRPPAYRLFRPRNLACVTIDGKRVYLGPYGSQESRDKYAALIADWEQRGRRPHVPSRTEQRRARSTVAAAAEPVPPTLVQLVDRFLVHAKRYYAKRDGSPGNEFTMFRFAARPMVGSTAECRRGSFAFAISSRFARHELLRAGRPPCP